MHRIFLLLAFAVSASAAHADALPRTIGTVKSEAPAFLRLVPKDAKVHVLAEGFTWAEGPVWIADGGYLLLSDVPKNRMYRWTPGSHAASVFLEPSGGTETKGFREPGSNGLKSGGRSRLLVAEGNGFRHGAQQIAYQPIELDIFDQVSRFFSA